MLFADGWLGSPTSLIDLCDSWHPKLTAQFKGVGEFSFPYSHARLVNGNVLVTLQGLNGTYGAPGGLAELSPDGRLLCTAAAAAG